VDETSQETAATFVLLAVVVAGDDRNILLHWLSAVEHATGKGNTPWHTWRHPARQAFMDQVLHDARFRRSVLYAVYPGTRSSHELTRLTIAKALGEPSRGQPSRVTVIIDGLPHSAVRLVSVG
jgi:hypothetical protein